MKIYLKYLVLSLAVCNISVLCMEPKEMELRVKYYAILDHTIRTRTDFNNLVNNKLNEQKDVKQALNIATHHYNQMGFFRRYFTYQGWKLSHSIQENTVKYKAISLFELDCITFFGQYKFPLLPEPADHSR